MKTRNLYAEIAEGFAALADARDGTLALREIYVSIPELWQIGSDVSASGRVNSILDLHAGNYLDAESYWPGTQ